MRDIVSRVIEFHCEATRETRSAFIYVRYVCTSHFDEPSRLINPITSKVILDILACNLVAALIWIANFNKLQFRCVSILNPFY